MFQEKAHQTAEHKEKEKTLTNKHETTLNYECPTGISHLQLGQPSSSLGTGTALAIINTTYLGGMAYSKGTDFEKVSSVGAAATSSVRSFQSLIALGEKENFCSQYKT